MKHFRLPVLYNCIGISLVRLFSGNLSAQTFQLQTQYASISINGEGFITAIKDKKTGTEYCPKGMSSALMSLCNQKQYFLTKKAVYNAAKQEISLTYSNGATAKIKSEQKQQYLRFQLMSLNGQAEVDNGQVKSIIFIRFRSGRGLFKAFKNDYQFTNV